MEAAEKVCMYLAGSWESGRCMLRSRLLQLSVHRSDEEDVYDIAVYNITQYGRYKAFIKTKKAIKVVTATPSANAFVMIPSAERTPHADIRLDIVGARELKIEAEEGMITFEVRA